MYEAIRLPTTNFEREDVADIVRTERKARLLLEQIGHRVGLRQTAPSDGKFQTAEARFAVGVRLGGLRNSSFRGRASACSVWSSRFTQGRLFSGD